MFNSRLRDQLGLRMSEPSVEDVPIRLTFRDGHTLQWKEVEGGDPPASGGISARFVGELGLVADLSLKTFAGSSAVQIGGRVTNTGSSTITGISGVSTLSLRLDLQPAQHGTLVRTWQGARFLPNYFPPTDFTPSDRYLVETPQVHTPLAVHGGADGRSSSGDLSFMQLRGSAGGVTVGVEWSGTWYIAVRQDASTDPGRREGVELDAGIWGIPLDLAPGEELPLPEVTLVPFDGDGFDGQNAMRQHIRDQVSPKLGGEPVLPPTSFNSWFAFENDFTDALLRPSVDLAAQVGLEYFVVDGGWYTRGFREGIGNWSSGDPAKFPDGVASFSNYVRAAGMKYGTWFEPEFAHVESELYKAKPDWFIPAPADSPYETPTNHQFGEPMTHYALLDFGLEEVQSYWVDRVTEAYQDWGVRWIRWDFNQQPRPHWEQTSRAGWAQVHHVEGFYRVLDHMIDALPDLFIEQCASGGHRIDLGTVRRGHSFWMNDHTTETDIVRRLQTRLNQTLPGNYANTNLCQPRHDFTDYDFLSHSAGGFGYSGRLWEASSTQLANYEHAWDRFKSFRALLQGEYSYELDAPDDPSGREVHVWREGQQALTMEFNGPAGERTAEVTFDAE